MDVSFNLNQHVKVKLTDYGLSILKQRRDELNMRIKSRGGKDFGEYEPKLDEQGMTSFQLWYLMEVFGPHIGLAKEQPFHLDIILCGADPLPKEVTANAEQT